MKIKISLLLYALSLWVVAPVFAQNNGNGNGGGNGSGKGHGHGHGHSDKGGPDDNGSDKGGPDDNGSDKDKGDKGDKGDHGERNVQIQVKTVEVVNALSTGSLTTSAGVLIPLSAQRKVYAVLTRTAGTTSPVPQLSAALPDPGPHAGSAIREALAANWAQLSAPLAAAGPGAEATIPPLVRSLSGLAYNPDWLPTVITNYNNFVQSASASFLADPPPEFLAVHAVLAQLTTAARGPKLTATVGGN
jgi:hypothetical protein